MRRKNSQRGKKKIIAFDFFSGAGGVTNGFIKAGIKVIAGFDNDERVKFAYEKNNSNAKFFHLDIIDTKKHVEVIKSILSNIEYDYLVFSACAPCQPFSNQKRHNGRDSRKSLLLSFNDVIDKLPKKYLPDFIFFENVGPIQSRGKQILSQIISYLNRADYRILTPKIIDASLFGVPQKRKRLIFLAARKETIKNFDIFNWPYFFSKYGQRAKTVREAIGNLPPIKAGEKDKKDPLHISRAIQDINLRRIKQIKKPGGSRSSWSEDLILKCHKSYKGHTDVYGRMDWNSFAPTLTTKCNSISNGRFGHPEQNRAISLREAAILQTMDNYKFEEPIVQESTARMIGNAVPPKLMQKFGRFIIELTKGT